jgi:integrase
VKKRPSGYYGVEIRHRRLEGGRLDLSLGVPVGASGGASARDNQREAKRREAAVRLMVERGEWRILRDLRAGKFSPADLANAVRDGQVDNLRRVGDHPLTLGVMIDRVLEEKRATQEPGTVEHYEKVCRSLVKEWGRERDLTTITTDEAKGWLYRARRGGKAWAANTQAGYHMVAAYVWRTAIALELESSERLQARPRLTRNLWDNVIPAGERTRRHSFLEPPEWSDLYAATRGYPQAAFLALGCLAGLRIQEALHLRTGIDVDLEAGLIRVQPREGARRWIPKGDNSVREIPIFPALRTILEEHAPFVGERYFIRPLRADKPLSYTGAKRWTVEAFTAAGLQYGREGEALTFHSLRHTFASWLVREGWSSTLVARWLGNTSREVERTYAHLVTTDLHKLGNAINALVGHGSSVTPSSGSSET